MNDAIEKVLVSKTIERIRKMQREKLLELETQLLERKEKSMQKAPLTAKVEEKSKPLQEILKDYGNPHATIIITCDTVEFVESTFKIQ